MAPKKKLAARKKAASLRQTRASAPRPRAPPQYSNQHEAVLTGLTDPFSSEAAKAQYPDQGAGRSLTVQTRIGVTLSTDANGNSCMGISPKANFPYITFASISGTTVTWPATWNAGGNVGTSLLNAYGKAYRPTSFGVRLSNLLSATASAGYIVICKGGPPVLSGTTTFIPSNFTHWDAHSIEHGGEWHATGHPTSAISYDMRDITTFNANNSQADATWETIYVTINGSAASQNILYVELFFNFEYVPLEDAIISQLAVPQPVMSVPMMTAVNHVQSVQPGSHKGTKDKVKGFLKQEAKKALFKHVLPFVEKKGLAALSAI